MLFGNSPALTASLVAKVRAATKRPLIVKLSPNAPDLVAVGAGRARRRRGHPVAHQHARRHGDRSRDGEAAHLLRHGRPLGPGDQADRGAHGLSGRARAAGHAADGHRRHLEPRGRPRVPRRRAPSAVQVGTANFRIPRSRDGSSGSSRPTAARAAVAAASLVGRAHAGRAAAPRRGGRRMSAPNGSASRSTSRRGPRPWRRRGASDRRSDGSRSDSRPSCPKGRASSRRSRRREGLPRPEVPRHPEHGRGRRRRGGALGRVALERARLRRPRDAPGGAARAARRTGSRRGSSP